MKEIFSALNKNPSFLRGRLSTPLIKRGNKRIKKKKKKNAGLPLPLVRRGEKSGRKKGLPDNGTGKNRVLDIVLVPTKRCVLSW
jgi:hypothetical protein